MFALDEGRFDQRVAATAIDFNTCGMDAVIARSLLLHPSLLGDALREVACTHRQFARVCFDRVARGIASDMAAKLEDYINRIELGGAFPPGEFGTRIMVFDAAARLNCLTPILAEAIARRESDGMSEARLARSKSQADPAT